MPENLPLVHMYICNTYNNNLRNVIFTVPFSITARPCSMTYCKAVLIWALILLLLKLCELGILWIWTSYLTYLCLSILPVNQEQ